MARDLTFWMIPDEIKTKLAELFADFRVKHPEVELEELTEFIKGYENLVQRWIDLDDSTPKN